MEELDIWGEPVSPALHNLKWSMDNMALDFLSKSFVEAMDDIGRHGHEKYGDEITSERKNGPRWTSEAIALHAAEHFQMHIRGELHDHFKTRKHQLAAVAYNAMMEFYFAGLEEESGAVHEARTELLPEQELERVP